MNSVCISPPHPERAMRLRQQERQERRNVPEPMKDYSVSPLREQVWAAPSSTSSSLSESKMKLISLTAISWNLTRPADFWQEEEH